MIYVIKIIRFLKKHLSLIPTIYYMRMGGFREHILPFSITSKTLKNRKITIFTQRRCYTAGFRRILPVV